MRPLLQQVPFKDAALVSRATPEKSFRTVTDPATLQAETPAQQATSQATDNKQDRLVYYRGEASKLPRLSGKSRQFKVKTLQLNFEQAPARDVATTVIAQALGLTVAVADGAEGTITLSSPEPLPVRAALDALETVLAESGLALIETGSGFMLTSLETAQNSTQSLSGESSIGYQAMIRPVDHTTPSNIVKLATPFLGKSITLTPDDAEGVITLRGPRTEIAQALDMIKMFDTPALAGRVSGLFDIQYADVSDLKAEIESIIATDSQGAAAAIQLIDLPRINQLLVVTRTKSRFSEVQSWIERLDVASGGDERRLRYYVIQNSPADVLTQQLSSAFGGGGFSGLAQESTGGAHSTTTRDTAPRPASTGYAGGGQNQSISITADTINNALIIRATDAEYREVMSLVDKMDVMPPQVLIEATIAEVTLSDNLKFGVRWFLENGGTDLTFSDNESGAVGGVFPGFSATYFKDMKAGVAINLLSSVTDVTVLSAPSIMVQNNQSANLQVGDEVPIITQQAQSVSDGNAPIISTVQLRETGVLLDVKPRITANGMVVLEVSQEVSEVAETSTGGINTPTIQQRQFTSTVAVPNNGTVALGGLIRESRTNNNSGIPGLKNAPLIGNLFRSKDRSARRTELIIFLTPRIVRNRSESEEVLDYLQSKMESLTTRLDR